MCGIGGLIGIERDREVMANRLLAALRHRGPDDEGVVYPAPSVTLVHSRLAIIELSRSGHQPMADHPGDGRPSNWVVFNGEIYNYRELRGELSGKGWQFRSNSDTEVILHSYRAWGDDCVNRWRGMFAICLIDSARGIAHLYRDRLGIKPLYLHRTFHGGVVFASEIRALLALGPQTVAPEVNPGALESYLAQGAVQGYDTLIRGVTMLRPGEVRSFELTTGRELERRTYWQLGSVPGADTVREAQVERLHALALEAVKLHLVSDAPLGLFLSGGVDSTALLALTRELAGQPPRTLSIGFESGKFDESADAAKTARAFGVDHDTFTITEREILDGFDAGLAAMDQPTVDGLNTYFISRAARQAGLTVALSGLGGDELFGGYAGFTEVPRLAALKQRFLFDWSATLVGSLIGNRFGAKLVESARRPCDPLTLHLLRRELFLPHERRRLQPLPDGSDAVTGVENELSEELRKRAAGLDDINRISFFEMHLYMHHMLLRDADAFSMAAPIEYRVPFLDHRMVEAVFALPGSWKRPDPRPKPLLIDMIGARLPQAVWRRPKRGFAFPWAHWFSSGGALAEIGRDAANDSATWRNLGIQPQGAFQIWKRFIGGDRRVSPLQVLAFVALRDFTLRHRLRLA